MSTDGRNPNTVLSLEQIRRVSDAMRTVRGIERAYVFLEGAGSTEFLCRAVVAEWMLRRFPRCTTAVAFRDASPQRGMIVDCAPSLGIVMDAHPDSPVVMPVDWFDIGVDAPVGCDDPAWHDNELSRPDIVLLPSMLPTRLCFIKGLAADPPQFDMPPQLAADGMLALAEKLGGTEDWFVCIDTGLDRHFPGVIGGPIPDDPRGGSIPLEDLGAPGIDRSALAFGLAAIVRARFVISANPFHLALASAFRVPLCAAGIDSWTDCVWNAGDIVLTRATVERDDRSIARAVETLMTRTEDCTGWRRPARRPPPSAAKSIALPLQSCSENMVEIWEEPKAR